MTPGSAAPTPSVSLLEVQNFRLHSRPTEAESALKRARRSIRLLSWGIDGLPESLLQAPGPSPSLPAPSAHSRLGRAVLTRDIIGILSANQDISHTKVLALPLPSWPLSGLPSFYPSSLAWEVRFHSGSGDFWDTPPAPGPDSLHTTCPSDTGLWGKKACGEEGQPHGGELALHLK